VIILVKKKHSKKSKRKTVSKISNFGSGLGYPWGEPVRLFNILWALIPIIGWLALIGYCQNILRAIIAGNKEKLPEFVSFGDNLERGFILFVKLIPLAVVFHLLHYLPLGGLIQFIGSVFFMPYLIINLYITNKFEESFNFRKVWDAVFNNLGEYVVAYLKTLGFVIIYGMLSIVLIGIPCLAFGSMFYLAEFYKNHS